MTEREIPQLVRDLIYAQEHHLVDDKPARAAVQALQHGVVDDLVRSLIQEPVKKHRIAQAFVGPFALPDLAHGGMKQGIDLRGQPVRYPIQYLNAHSLTCGGSGSGKTTKARSLSLQVAPEVEGCWWFDFVKREFSVLKLPLARLGVNLMIVPARELRLNPLQCPKGVTPIDWAPRFADALVGVFDLPAAATKLVHRCVLELYHRHDILAGSRHFPTMFELRNAIAESDGHPQAKRAVVDALDPTLMSMGSVFAYRIGWKTCDLARKHLVFELGGVAEVDKDLILNTLVLSEFASRVAQGISNPAMDLWICCDEAARLVSARRRSGAIASLIGSVRGTGIGLDLSVLSGDIAPAVLSNTANKFLGRCTSATDVDLMAGAMGLTQEQRRWVSMNLRPGLFVGQIGEGDWRQPFVVEIPWMRPGSFTSAEDGGSVSGLEELMALPVAVADEFIGWQRTGRTATDRSPAAATGNGGVSDVELRYIQAVIHNPGAPSSMLPKLARISPKRAQKTRSRLVELGYFREHKVSTGKRGRTAIVLEPLEPALQAVQDATSEPT